MKYITLILLLFLGLKSFEQTINPALGTVSNKSYSPAQAIPTDYRSRFDDQTNFIMRDFQSLSEVRTYLNLAKYRTGNFPIFVHVGGVLNGNGTYTGGVTIPYWFNNGTADGDLVPMFPITSVNGQVGTVVTKNADSIRSLPVDTSAAPRNNYLLTFDSILHKWKLTAPASAYTGGIGIDITGPVISALNTQALWNSNAVRGRSYSTTPPTVGQSYVWDGIALSPSSLNGLDTAYLSNDTLYLVNTFDTIPVFLNYIHPADTSAFLRKPLVTGGASDSIVTVVNGVSGKVARSSFGVGGFNSNIGSGYRLAVPNTNNVKTLSVGYGITNDSTTNANSITQKLDTATVFPQIRSTIPAVAANRYKITTTIDSLRLYGDADTAHIYRLLENGQVSDFYYDDADVTSVDDSVMIIVTTVGSKRLKRYIPNAQLLLRWFGANNQDAINDQPQIQKCINWGIAHNYKNFLADPDGRYLVNGADIDLGKWHVTVPAGGNTPMMTFDGNNSLFETTDTGRVIFKKTTVDLTSALSEINSRLHFKNVRITGGILTHNIGLRLVATYGSVIENCSFIGCDTAVDMQFDLKAIMQNNFYQYNTKIGLLLRSGGFTGSDGNNSQCNQTTVTSDRHVAYIGQQTCVRVVNSSDIRLADCIFEGSNPVHNIEFYSLGSTTVNQFYVTNTHVENAPTDCGIQVYATSGWIYVDNYWAQISHTWLKREAGGGDMSIVFDKIPFATVMVGIETSNATHTTVNFTNTISTFNYSTFPASYFITTGGYSLPININFGTMAGVHYNLYSRYLFSDIRMDVLGDERIFGRSTHLAGETTTFNRNVFLNGDNFLADSKIFSVGSGASISNSNGRSRWTYGGSGFNDQFVIDYLGNKVGIKKENPLQALHVGGQVAIDTVTTGGGSDSVLVINNNLIKKVLQSSIGGSGTVTSVATNNGTGITGGTITATGTLALDTTNTVSTKLYRQKGIDSVVALIGNTIYTGNGTFSGSRTIDAAGYYLLFNNLSTASFNTSGAITLNAGTRVQAYGAIQNTVIESSAGTLTLDNALHYIFNGTTTTWTLPSLGSYNGVSYYIKNAGSGNITLQRGGSDNLYDTGSVTSITILPGEARLIVGGNSFWYVE